MKERRRGADLEDALLNAAWLELSEHGYAALSLDAVAARAGTSRPVLARRWDGRTKLAIAAIRRRIADHPVSVPDRGDVRTELMEFLDLMAERVTALASTLLLFAAEHFRKQGATLAEMRTTLLYGEINHLAPILDRAVKRGEIDPKKLTPPITSLLVDLFRHHAIMTWEAPSPALRAAWIDTIFLPLVRQS